MFSSHVDCVSRWQGGLYYSDGTDRCPIGLAGVVASSGRAHMRLVGADKYSQ
jgi:hypothetical protein